LLDEELQQLPMRYRTPFLLCFVEGQTRDQVAAQICCSIRTLHRAWSATPVASGTD